MAGEGTPVSADGCWRWNGYVWVSTAASQPSKTLRQRVVLLGWPKWLLAFTGFWLAALVAWVPAAAVTLDRSGTSDQLVLLVASGVAAAVVTIALGAAVGWTGRWRHGGVFVALGTALLLASYVFAMLAFSDPNDSTTDNAAGAGLVILAVPTLLLVATLIALGAGIGWLLRVLVRRPTRRSSV